MKLQIGSLYKTRKGEKAFVYSKDPSDDVFFLYVVVGDTYKRIAKESGENVDWSMEYDLIEEWPN